MITIKEAEFRKLAELMKERYGIHLGNEKQALVTGRLQTALTQKNFTNFAEFYEYVLKDKTGEALRLLVDRITTNHTYFMREVKHFQFFRDTVLPYLAVNVKSKDLRIWSAGCSSGEEPYTLAMILADYFGREKNGWDTKILATDISSKVMEVAERGIYLNEQLANLPDHWRKQYFRKLDEERSTVVEVLRQEVLVRKFNLMDPFSFKKRFHVIFCRNVMIYFDARTKAELINKFYEYTEPGGYLFIGHSESLNREETAYRYVMPAVYRKE